MPTKISNTAEYKKALAMAANKKTFGDQIAALAANGNLNPKNSMKQGTQAYANRVLAYNLMEQFLKNYQNFTTKTGAKWDLPDWELNELVCIIGAAMTGSYDNSMSKWYAFDGGTIQNACKLVSNKPSATWPNWSQRNFEWAMKHLAARDAGAAMQLEQALTGYMLNHAEEQAAQQVESFKKGVKETLSTVVNAPGDLANALTPTWLKVALWGGTAFFLYTLYKNREAVGKVAASAALRAATKGAIG